MANQFVTPASLLCDFYKVSHKDQYPEGTQVVYSTWTPRMTRIEGVDEVMAFGFQSFIKDFLIFYFNRYFFIRPKKDVVAEYTRVIKFTLGVDNPDASHIAALHDLGYLPLRIRAVKEGTLVPLRVPMLTIENTLPEREEFKFLVFWITNYLETIMSSEIWLPTTIATIAFQYRKLLERYAAETVGNNDYVMFQGHDFSMRGLEGLNVSEKAGIGHLLSFVGTDTIPAILAAEAFYNANIETELVGTSIPATEHSVMCAGGKDSEFETYKRLITKVYPKGFLSIVSDTWDLWYVLDVIIRKLKDDILARDGRIVIRPDSGDPVKIICGDPDAPVGSLAWKGVIQILWEIFGGTVNELGYKMLDLHIGAIYGDAITIARARAILEGLKAKGFASSNMVFGIGSYTYQYNTRDTFGFALKATYVEINGEGQFILKDPVTDSGVKKSATGMVAVVRGEDGKLKLIEGLDPVKRAALADVDLLEDVFVDGKLVRDQSLTEIRAIVSEQI